MNADQAMRFFFGRLVVFVVVITLALVIGPSFVASRFAPERWLFAAVYVAVLSAGLFVLVFGVSELIRRSIPWIDTTSPARRDLVISACFLLFCGAFLFLPRPEGFSFGDNVGLIIEDGALTAYGIQVQLKALGDCALLALAFWGICRLPGLSNRTREAANKPDAP